jgi:hypothetical protein
MIPAENPHARESRQPYMTLLLLPIAATASKAAFLLTRNQVN